MNLYYEVYLFIYFQKFYLPNLQHIHKIWHEVCTLKFVERHTCETHAMKCHRILYDPVALMIPIWRPCELLRRKRH
jgi:hypothetical protein